MIIKHYNFDSEIVLSLDIIRLLVIENSNELYNKVSELIGQCCGIDGGFIISEDGKDVNFLKKSNENCKNTSCNYNRK